MPFASRPARFFGAAALLSVAAALFGCPKNKCWVRFQTVENGKTTSDKCLVDTCPKNASYQESIQACQCEANFVTLGGACVTLAEANTSCGKGYQYANGGCIAKTCPPGQILDAQTDACQNKQAVDQQVASRAGVTLKEGQSVGCPGGYTYVVNGTEGACIPNELTCGTGTKYEGGKCVAIACPAGQVFDGAAGGCVKLNTGGDEKTFSVQAKLKAAMGPDFCAPLAKNPSGFNVQPGQTQTIKVSVTVSVPGNDIEQTQLTQVKTTNLGGAELTPQIYPGIARVNKQVTDQVIPSIKALGGKSIEPSASAEVTCVIKRAPIQVIDTHGGGV